MPKKKKTKVHEEELLVLHEKWVEVAKRYLREIIIGVVIIVLAAIGWALFQYQHERQEAKAWLAYLKAVMAKRVDRQKRLLSEVITHYGQTSAALQAHVDLLDLAYRNGDLKTASNEIEMIKRKAKAEMKFFALLGEGYLFEENKAFAKARSDYEKVAKARIGLEYLAWPDLARVAELLGDYQAALDYYRQFMILNPQGEISDFVKVKISKLEVKKGVSKK